jgi:KDO2-lipid IV(A) lauroyltransferase
MKFKYILEYGAVRFLDLFFRLLPLKLSLKFGEYTGLLLSCLLPKRRKLIVDNLTKSFPDYSHDKIEEIATLVWRNLGKVAVEFIHLPLFSGPDFDRYITVEGKENVEKALTKGSGILMVTFHFTNWEITGITTQHLFRKLMAIARPMKNPLVENWVSNKRSSGGMKITLHREAVKASLKWLKQKNAMIGILADQNLYTGGIFVDFFGRPAATTTLPALLSLRCGSPVIICSSLRENGKFKVVYEPPLEFPVLSSKDDQLNQFTQQIQKRFEDIIRLHPENWFWIHNRWKRKSESV